jgi:hypothetical protein
MTFIPIHRPSNLIDVHLTTTDKEIHKLIDEILDEIIIIKEITNRSRSRECLKKVVLNLIHTEKTGGSVSISRTKNDYSQHRMYGKIWFKYDRLIPIIDGLIELGYVEFVNGFWDKEKKRGCRSKIWASEKFRDRLIRCQYKNIQRTAPEQIIHLKDADKKLVKISWDKPKVKMRDRLEQYNHFIQEQHITVNLTEPTWTDNEFWLNNLLKGLLNGSYSLDGLKLNQAIYPTDTNINNKSESTNPESTNQASSVSSSHPSTMSSTHPSTSSTISSPYPSTISSILYPNITTSTLISHIHILLSLSSTHTKQRRQLVDKALMISNEQLLNYFLNWLFFLNTAIRKSKTDDQTRRIFRMRRTLGDLGIAELIFKLKYQSLHRVYNQKSFKKGGRFYGASHLNIPGHMRGFIHINGEPVVELDYDALHVAMLYHLRGIDINLEQDPYEMIEGPEDRAIKKTALLTAINAPSDTKAIRGIRKKLVDDGIKGETLTDKSLKNLLGRAKLAHPAIASDIGSGKGILLQNIDSKIADAILTSFMAENIPALPVHDSFIVPRQHEDRLRELMITEYEKVLKFKPGVSKKKKRYRPKKWKN